MAQGWTTTELLAQIRDDARLADDDPEATSAILLRRATRILQDSYAPAVRACRSDYYVAYTDIVLTTGRASYPIPRRALTSSVRLVRAVDSSGREVELMPAPLEDVSHQRAGFTGRPCVYCIADDRIVVSPTPNSSAYTLRLAFEYRPSSLVAVDGTGAAYTYTVSSSYASSLHTIITKHDLFDDTDVVDVVRRNAPFSSPVIDATINARGAEGDGYAIDLSSYSGLLDINLGLDASTSGGDYVCFAGESPVPQIPAELHPCLAMHAAAEFLISIDPAGAAALKMQADEKMARALSAMQPRKQGQQMKLKPRVRYVKVSGGGGRGNTFGDLS